MDQPKDRPGHESRDLFRRFGDELRRNGRIIRIRFDLAGLTRRRDRLVRDLGLRVYRLIQLKKLEIREVAHLVAGVQALDGEIEQKEKGMRSEILGTPASGPGPSVPPKPAEPPKPPAAPPPAEKPEPPKVASPVPPPRPPEPASAPEAPEPPQAADPVPPPKPADKPKMRPPNRPPKKEE